MIKFSVIIPAFNVENYIQECLDSVYKQTYKNYEIIVIDDGSTDKTNNILQKKENLTKIKLIHQTNSGLSVARNIGAEKAGGDYILFLDSDDWWERDLLEKLNKILDEKKTDIIGFQLQKYYEDKNVYKKTPLPQFENQVGSYALEKYIESHYTFETAVTYAFNLKFWNNNKFTFAKDRYHEDFGLIPYVIFSANSISSIDYVGYNYRQRPHSITKTINYEFVLKKVYDTLFHIKFLMDKFNNKKISYYQKELIANYLMTSIILKMKKLKFLDRTRICMELRKIKVYKLFGNNIFISYIKKVMIIISPAFYMLFTRGNK